MEDRPPEFDTRVLSYLPGLHSLARRISTEPEDLVSETVEWALEKWRNFREGGSFWAWLKINMFGLHTNRTRRFRPLFVDIDDALSVGTPASQEHETDLRRVASLLHGRDGAILARRAMGELAKEIGADVGLDRSRVQQIEHKTRASLLKSMEPRRAAA